MFDFEHKIHHLIRTEQNENKSTKYKEKEKIFYFPNHFQKKQLNLSNQNLDLIDELTLLKTASPTEQAILLTLQKIYSEIKVNDILYIFFFKK